MLDRNRSLCCMAAHSPLAQALGGHVGDLLFAEGTSAAVNLFILAFLTLTLQIVLSI
jgi:hypothetical protein